METNNIAVRLSSIIDLPTASQILENDIFLISKESSTSKVGGTTKYLFRKASLSCFPTANSTTNGFMCSADWNKLNRIASGANNYALPKATFTQLGGIRIGANLSIDENGILSAEPIVPYELSIATSTTLGGIKVGYLEAELNKFALKLNDTDNAEKGKAYVEVPTFTPNKAGLVPQSVTASNDKFLNAKGEWTKPIGTTYGIVSANYNGLCPALPDSNSEEKFLRGDGQWSKIQTPESISFDDIYPINSIYISINQYLPESFNGKGTWKRIASGCCLWGTDVNGSNVGEPIAAGLPNIMASTTITNSSVSFSGTTSQNGEHSHKNNAYSPGPGPLDIGDNVGGSTSNYTSSSGKHSHTFSRTASFSPTATTTLNKSNIYGNSNTVQPPALVVSMWQRVS